MYILIIQIARDTLSCRSSSSFVPHHSQGKMVIIKIISLFALSIISSLAGTVSLPPEQPPSLYIRDVIIDYKFAKRAHLFRAETMTAELTFGDRPFMMDRYKNLVCTYISFTILDKSAVDRIQTHSNLFPCPCCSLFCVERTISLYLALQFINQTMIIRPTDPLTLCSYSSPTPTLFRLPTLVIRYTCVTDLPSSQHCISPLTRAP